MSKNKLLLLLVCLLLLSLLAGNIFNYKTIYKQSAGLKNFDSTKEAPVVLTGEKYTPPRLPKNVTKSISISFDFKINGVKQWDNLFQTADYNNGIRMELDKGNNCALVINSSGDTGLVGIPLQKFDNNIWYNVRIIKKTNELPSVFVNNKKQEIIASDTELINNTNSFAVDKIIIGSGFDQNRTFNGQIKNFKCSFSVKVYNHTIEKIFSIIIYCILFLLIILSVLKAKEEYKINENKFIVKNLLLLLLFNLYPITFAYISNINELVFAEFLEFVLISSALISAVYAILYKFIKSDKLYFILFLLIACFYMTGHLYNKFFLIYSVENYLKVIISLCVITVTGCIFCNKKFEQFIKVSEIVTAMLLAMAVLSNCSLISSHFKIVAASLKNKSIASKDNSENDFGKFNVKRPNIYFVILDGYINSSAAKKYYDFDNSKFLETLRSKGFYIADYSMSNYGHTKFSVPSMLNFNYLKNLGIDSDSSTVFIDDKLNKLYTDNKLISDYVSKLYNIYYINLENTIARNFNEKYVYKTFLPPDNNSEYTLTKMILQNSFLFFNTDNFGLAHRNNVYAAFDYIKECAANNSQNKFIFAHILCPHSPYVFLQNGEIPKEKDRKDIINKNTYILNSKGYFEQIKYLNTRIIQLFEYLIKNNPESVVIFISDHGYLPDNKSYPYDNPSFMYNDDDYYVRAGNFEAVYFPDGDYSMLYDTITPVNLVRVLLNKYFDANLPLLEDKHYFSETYVKYEPIDVTQNVQKQLTENK